MLTTMLAENGYAASDLMGKIAAGCIIAILLVLVLRVFGIGKSKSKK